MNFINRLFRKAKNQVAAREPFLIVATKLSLSSGDKTNECEECMKRNEELALNIFDCEEECSHDDENYIVTKVRFSVYSIEEYFPMNEEETWIKIDGRFGKYMINSEKLDGLLSEYITFLQ